MEGGGGGGEVCWAGVGVVVVTGEPERWRSWRRGRRGGAWESELQ